MPTSAMPNDCDELVRACETLEAADTDLDTPAGRRALRALDHALRTHLAKEEDALLPRFYGLAPVETAALRTEHAELRGELAAVAHGLRHGHAHHAHLARLVELVRRHAAHEHGPKRDRELAIAALCDDAELACELHDLRELAELAERLATYMRGANLAHLTELAECCRDGREFEAFARWQQIAHHLHAEPDEAQRVRETVPAHQSEARP